MADDWYARRLGQQQPQARQHPIKEVRQSVSRTYPPVYTQQRQPSDTAPEQDPSGEELTLHNFVNMMGRWRGGKATKTEKTPCPECGSPHYFSRANSGGRNGAPAPHCFSCGYAGGLFPTQGDPTVWQAG